MPTDDRTASESRVGLTDLFCGSLFSGCGGMDLGLERAGIQVKWQVEIDPFARRVLERHWPDVRRWDDVRTWPQPDTEPVDLLCGGFPCQAVSVAGLRRGTADERWLWPEFARIIRILRPRVVLLENTPGLLTAGFDSVLGDLAALGFDAEWSVLSACALGAPHTRERLFVVAHADGCLGKEGIRFWEHGTTEEIQARYDLTAEVLRLESEHRRGRNIDGISRRVDHRLRVVGNAVCVPVAEWIGQRIVAACS